MPRVAVIARTEEGATALADLLTRQGLEATVVASEDAIECLGQLAPDAIAVEFYARDRLIFDAIAGNESLRERSALIACLGPAELRVYETAATADDFVLLPALPEELAARVRLAVKRRAPDTSNILRAGDLTLDLANYRVAVAGRPVELTFKEYELLRFLVQNPDKVLTREALLKRVWGYDYFGGSRTVDVHIRRLRSKLEDRGHTFIETIRNVGYRFVCDGGR
ncbi:MAG: response regulator transcription factor [Dehalococcoidia bacterium]|nr:response regulator transcription factor [Dehalococcoidia bacterium]